jgi:hypothetical protein
MGLSDTVELKGNTFPGQEKKRRRKVSIRCPTNPQKRRKMTVMQSGAKGTLRRGPYSFFFSVARRVRMFWIECLARSGGERGGSCEATAVRAFFAEVRTFLALMEMIETSYSVMPPPEVTRKLVRRSLDGSEGCLALSTRGSRSTLIWDIDLRSEVIAFFVSSWRSVVAGLNLRPTAVKKGQRKQ